MPGAAVEAMAPAERKQSGSHYTPSELADFVAREILSLLPSSGSFSLLDPAVGDGQLVRSMLRARTTRQSFKTTAFDINDTALRQAKTAIESVMEPAESLSLNHQDFLADFDLSLSLFSSHTQFDVCISNPPYVRTQVIGADASRELSRRFGLTGRVDLYHAFILAIAHSLKPGGILGLIVSNRFLTTRAGESVRTAIAELFEVVHIWDLGDTKLFSAAVLPAVLLLRRKAVICRQSPSRFSRIYEERGHSSNVSATASSPVTALAHDGLVAVNGSVFKVEHGNLDWGNDPSGVWRLSHDEGDRWLATVAAHTDKVFADIGKVRVGVKTTADKVFIKKQWAAPAPELLRPLVTHHVGRCFRGTAPNRAILYTHKAGPDGRKVPVDLDLYPVSKSYLEGHGATLRARTYVIEANRQWFEIWVPQDPSLWSKRKIVFRDITEHPTFWLDEGHIVNGDCYWISVPDKLDQSVVWLALAVANSTFITEFYDRKFNNRLYAGRRRFQSQYVESFPLPKPSRATSLAAKLAEQIYRAMEHGPAPANLVEDLNAAVARAFGVQS